MRQRVRITLAVFCWALLVSFITDPFAAEEETQESPQAVTTSDPEIPVEELSLLLKPLTKDELLIEADAWQVLLKEKAEEIAKAEIAVQRQNREIDKAQEIQKRADEAEEHLEEVTEKAEEAKASGEMEQVEETASAAKEAREKVQEVGAAVEEATEAAEKTGKVREEPAPEMREGLEDAAEAAPPAADAPGRGTGGVFFPPR